MWNSAEQLCECRHAATHNHTLWLGVKGSYKGTGDVAQGGSRLRGEERLWRGRVSV
jgi:hypothetical protein